MSFNYKLTIEYDGTMYLGWADSIDRAIEFALQKLMGEKCKIIGAGRTDAGVHALGQVANFITTKQMEAQKIITGLNYFLRITGNTVIIKDCEEVNNDFHARFSAIKRYYKYRILNRAQPTILDKNRVWHIHAGLDFDSMHSCLPFFLGKKDWSCFRGGDCQAKSPIKTIDRVILRRQDEEIIFEIEAKSFLHHMVRNMVGTLVGIGLSRFKIADMEKIIFSKDRSQAGITAPAHGLYLVKIDYP